MSAYPRINFIMLALIGAIFCYSYFFDGLADHGLTIPSFCEKLPDRYCKTKGMSRAFHEISHGRIQEARSLNSHSVKLFVFFALQALARLICLFAYRRKPTNKIVYADALFSSIYFLITFIPLTPI